MRRRCQTDAGSRDERVFTQEWIGYLVVLKQLMAGRRTVHVQVSQRHHPQFLRQLSPGNIFHAQHLHELGQSVLVQP